MHLWVIARGHLDRLKRWENDLTAKKFPYLWNADTRFGGQYGMMQLSVRPIQLYEIIFPKPMLNDVLAMIQPYGGYGISPSIVSWARTLLKFGGIKLDPIPVVPVDMPQVIDGVYVPPKNYLDRDMVDVMGLGLMDDKDRELMAKVESL